jgi:hypothetical protein
MLVRTYSSMQYGSISDIRIICYSDDKLQWTQIKDSFPHTWSTFSFKHSKTQVSTSFLLLPLRVGSVSSWWHHELPHSTLVRRCQSTWNSSVATPTTIFNKVWVAIIGDTLVGPHALPPMLTAAVSMTFTQRHSIATRRCHTTDNSARVVHARRCFTSF